MKPGKFEEQPIPLMVATSWLGICNSTNAFCTAASTPKSPHPGHQSGSTLPLKSAIVVSFGATVSVAIVISPSSGLPIVIFSPGKPLLANLIRHSNCETALDHDLVHRNGKGCTSTQLLPHRLHNVVGHKGFAIVFADVSIGHETGFAAQVAGELAAVVVFDNDGVARAFQQVDNGVAMQRNKPADLQLIGSDPLLGKKLAGFFDYALGRSPADQGYVGVRWVLQLGR